MKKWIKTLFASMAVIGLAACGAGDESESASGDNANDEITIGYFPNLDHAAGIVGKQQGFFEEELENTDIEFRNFPNGNDFVESLDSGDLDIGYVGPGPAINYYLSGGDIKILSGAANGATLIVSSEDSGITSLDDFDGKSFCTPGNGCTHNVQLEIMLQELGLESNRVGGTVEHQSRVDPASMMVRFEQGEVDAAAAPEPWGTYLVEEFNANVVTEWNEVFLGETLPSVVLVTSEEFMENNPEQVKSVLEAHQKSVDFTSENEAETLNSVNDLVYELSQTEFSDAVLENAWERMNITTDVSADALQSWADASYDLGFIEDQPDLDGLVDTSLLEEVTAE
ncbi:NitT/TauT family transport system substrate-binding protein [Alteribacillus persepolensis]|uniref:NitT/TauT family transport system substrate-binding protein n=1 Tax=Alteribacillus persepolensis TaxID=568899 RepID=A0A1G8DFJ5_9BACI|nr:aliphatic sulfonate ABC transporter substrate-binding protein [Alteribacillus persepolensis]SDH56485.1 NitT/TauT family transport system substrate-binding protein [Alteribacillus persepolensis]